jgi:hypothetical protein
VLSNIDVESRSRKQGGGKRGDELDEEHEHRAKKFLPSDLPSKRFAWGR